MKRVLVVGTGSYIGESFRKYVRGQFEVKELEARDLIPEIDQFREFDVVFFVAGIAHRKETRKNAHLYYEVNKNLAISVAAVAKEAGVRQFIIMSTMAVYGVREGEINKKSKPCPTTHYGKSKLLADCAIWKMRDDDFKVAILRPPMVYGKGCKGNYQKLRKLALAAYVFPKTGNRRSMIYIGNLCEFVCGVIEDKKNGLFFPQNMEYVDTSEMVRLIALSNGKKIRLSKLLYLIMKKFGNLCMSETISKVLGNLTYEKDDIILKYSFIDSISLTESGLV